MVKFLEEKLVGETVCLKFEGLASSCPFVESKDQTNFELRVQTWPLLRWIPRED